MKSMTTPREWTEWFVAIKSFYSSHGAILTKIVVSMDLEGAFYMAAIESPNKWPEIDGMANKLHGVPLMFTTKLPIDRALFESVADRAA